MMYTEALAVALAALLVAGALLAALGGPLAGLEVRAAAGLEAVDALSGALALLVLVDGALLAVAVEGVAADGRGALLGTVGELLELALLVEVLAGRAHLAALLRVAAGVLGARGADVLLADLELAAVALLVLVVEDELVVDALGALLLDAALAARRDVEAHGALAAGLLDEVLALLDELPALLRRLGVLGVGARAAADHHRGLHALVQTRLARLLDVLVAVDLGVAGDALALVTLLVHVAVEVAGAGLLLVQELALLLGLDLAVDARRAHGVGGVLARGLGVLELLAHGARGADGVGELLRVARGQLEVVQRAHGARAALRRRDLRVRVLRGGAPRLAAVEEAAEDEVLLRAAPGARLLGGGTRG